MLPPSSVTRNPSKQKRSASCAELWIIGRSDTTTLRASRHRLFGKRGARHGESVRRRTWSKELGAGNRPDYRITDRWTTGEQSADRVKASLTRLREDRVKASLTRRCQRSEVGKRNDGEAPRYVLTVIVAGTENTAEISRTGG